MASSRTDSLETGAEADTVNPSLLRSSSLILVAAVLVMATGTAWAAQQDWTAEKPWWCNPGAQVCQLWSSNDTGISTYRYHCDNLLHGGWSSLSEVQTGCEE